MQADEAFRGPVPQSRGYTGFRDAVTDYAPQPGGRLHPLDQAGCEAELRKRTYGVVQRIGQRWRFPVVARRQCTGTFLMLYESDPFVTAHVAMNTVGPSSP
jgi:hypothetical protein